MSEPATPSELFEAVFGSALSDQPPNFSPATDLLELLSAARWHGRNQDREGIFARTFDLAANFRLSYEGVVGGESGTWEAIVQHSGDGRWYEVSQIAGPWWQQLRDIIAAAIDLHIPNEQRIQQLRQTWTPSAS